MELARGTQSEHPAAPAAHGNNPGHGQPAPGPGHHHPPHPSHPPHPPHPGPRPTPEPDCGRNGHGHSKQEFCFLFDEKSYCSPTEVVTVAWIRQQVGVPAGTAITQVNQDGTQTTLNDDQTVKLVDCSKFRRLPRFTRGRHLVLPETASLEAAYPGCVLGPNQEYLLIPGFKLPPGLYVQSAIDLLVLLQPTYPDAAPDNFYVTWGLALQGGGAINNYSGPVTLIGREWGTFSHHLAPGIWSHATGDSLLSYLSTVQARLQEGA